MGRADLWRAENFPVFWSGVVLPWIEAQAGGPPDGRPAVVLVPSRSVGYFLKGLWIESGAGGVGVRFWTPGDLREHLRSAYFPGRELASREVLHLLLSSAAEAAGGDGLAAAIAADPSGLMRSIDDVSAAGWPWEELGAGGVMARVFQEFRARLDASGLWTAQACDWALAGAAAKREAAASIRAMLVYGFTGAHWPLWPLLLAGARSAEALVVTLAYPRREAERIDQVWTGSWEEETGIAARELGEAAEAGPFRRLAEQLEAGDLAATAARGRRVPAFEVGDHAEAEAGAIAGRVLEWLAGGGKGRLAVVFPETGALARETARLLGRLDIPHNDALGFPAAPPEDEAAWREWLGLQDEWTAGRLDRFLARRPQGLWPQGDDAEALRDRIERAIPRLLDDNLAVLREALAASGEPRDIDACATLDALQRIPESGEFGALARAAAGALDGLGWTWRAGALRLRAHDPASRVKHPVRRRHFIAWLREAMESGGRDRGPSGREPYARVHLLGARDAEVQEWGAVILAGMIEGVWPRVPGADGFLPESRRNALNARAVRQGRQGEGHRAAAPGRGMLMGDAEWRYVGLRQCFNLIEGAREMLCFTARLRREDDPARLLGPADLLVKAHFASTGAMLADETMSRLALESKARWSWLRERTAASEGGAEWRAAGPAEVRGAYDARRRGDAPFGPYDFCLRQRPDRPIRLACKEWEMAWRFPPVVWLTHVAGVSRLSRLGESDAAALATGMWAHEWVARAINPGQSRQFVAAPEAGEAARRVGEAARASRARAEAAFRAAGRQFPVWWEAVWRGALWAAEAMCAEAVASGGFIGTEWVLPPDCAVEVEGGGRLVLRGRIDLIRAASARFGGALTVVDFKTGGDLKLTPSEIRKGFGLQIVLYGEALRALGADAVRLRIVRPGGSGADRDLDAAAAPGILRELARMQDTGAFGVRGEMAPEFGFDPGMPIATLPVDADISDLRWELSHGAGEENA